MPDYIDPARLSGANHAVIVAGHAIIRDLSDPTDENSWILLPYQRFEAHCYVAHIERAVNLTAEDPGALLIFSGGQSRREAGPRSEAQSYFWVADRYGWFGHPEAAARATTEEFSRDSFENFLFGICRFKEVTGSYPAHVTFVSWIFKRERFELHRSAVRWPRERFTYAGVNNPPELGQALEAEAKTRAHYERDPYSASPEYRAKRDARNPFRRNHGYRTVCPELTALFEYSGPALYPGHLPWS